MSMADYWEEGSEPTTYRETPMRRHPKEPRWVHEDDVKQEVETLRRERDELAKHNAELKQRVSALHKWADEWKRRTNFLRSWMLGRSFPHHSEFVTQWHEFLQDFPEAAEWFASPKWFEEEE